jgi:hypothetical protein
MAKKNLLQEKISRRNFLKIIGSAVAAFSLGGFFNFFARGQTSNAAQNAQAAAANQNPKKGKSDQAKPTDKTEAGGFGSMPYGA